MSADLLPILQSIERRLAAIESKIGSDNLAAESSPVGNGGGATPDLPRQVKAFDDYCTRNLEPFVAACAKIGGDVEKGGKIVASLWAEMRKFFLMASKCKEPANVASTLGEMSAKMKELGALVQRNDFENHMKTLSEGAQCVNWILVKPAPRDFIESFIGGSDYWANNIRKVHRTTNPDQISFCDTFKALLVELMAFVKDSYTTGVQWNPKGIDAKDFNADLPMTNATVATTPTATPASASVAASKPAAGPVGNIFAELNKGGEITSGLKTVTKDMQTWRKEYKADATPSAPAPAKKPAVTARAGEQVKGPAKVEYIAHGCKWQVENQSEINGVVTVEIADIKQNVYIYGCIGATINVIGKCKSIAIDSCKKCKVSFDEVFSTCETVNSARITVECRDKCAAVAIDKTDGIIVVLPTSSLETSIVASKSSEMNVQWPGPDGEMIERPIPEQYVHRISGTTVTADVSDLYTH